MNEDRQDMQICTNLLTYCRMCCIIRIALESDCRRRNIGAAVIGKKEEAEWNGCS